MEESGGKGRRRLSKWGREPTFRNKSAIFFYFPPPSVRNRECWIFFLISFSFLAAIFRLGLGLSPLSFSRLRVKRLGNVLKIALLYDMYYYYDYNCILQVPY